MLLTFMRVMHVAIICLLFGGLLGQTNKEEDGPTEKILQFFSRRRFTRASLRSCLVPNPPQNGNYTLFSPNCFGPALEGTDCWVPPGEPLEHGRVLTISCNDGYHLQGFTASTVVSLCSDGEWSQAFPQCRKMCVPLASPGVDLNCVMSDKEVVCNRHMQPGTVVTARCREHFTQVRNSGSTTIRCLSNGDWDHVLIKCSTSECGLPIPEDQVPIYSEQQEPQGRYPWMAVIYRQNSTGQWNQVCLGSLLSSNVVLTGARCLVGRSGILTAKDIRVGLGKYDRDYYKQQSFSYIFNASQLVIMSDYAGEAAFEVSDIGLVALAGRVELSGRIMPVCLDWQAAASLSPSTLGYVSGWNESQSETILSGEMNYIDHANCLKGRRVPLLMLTYDKFCADGVNGISVVGKGDRGGAFTILKDGRHYVVGVLSSKIQGYQNTAGGVSLFTNISITKHKDWVDAERIRLERQYGNCQGGTCDDNPTTTSTTTRAPPLVEPPLRGPTCMIPDPPENRQFTRYNCFDQAGGCGSAPGTKIPESVFLIVTCSPGYHLVQGVNTFASRALTSCLNGMFDPPIPKCYKLCRPLISLTVNFQCWQGPDIVSCNKPMLPGTVVQYSCKEYHESNDVNQANGMKCNPRGEWSREEPRCTPKCGQSNLNSAEVRPTIFGGNFSSPGNFPWHAAIYHRRAGLWEAVCGGTLITTRVVLTAAHCVTTKCVTCSPPPSLPTAEVMIGLGQNDRHWNSTEDTAVKRRILEIWVHQYYVGSSLNYGNDIAILKLESDVQVNNFVMPACVDYDKQYLKHLKEDKTLQGYVAGWGNTEECTSVGNICSSASDKLKYARTTIINFTECYKITQTIKTFSVSRLTPDKYCAGNGSESVVQQGDSGGGLTFLFHGLHYVYGVVSIKLKLDIGGKTFYTFGAFTSVTDHLPWLKTQLY